MIKISVIIPVYNAANTIVDSIESVIDELISNPYDWELILVNDGSKDDSKEVMNAYVRKTIYSSKIKIISQQNAGAAAARNVGIRNATGNYIAFNDSDDRWISGKIDTQMMYLIKHPEVDMVGGAHEIEKFPSIFKSLGYDTRIFINDIVKKNYFSPPTVIIRRKILDENNLLFDSKMRTGGEEGSLFYPLVYLGNCVLINVKMSESISGKKRWGESGLTSNIYKMEKGVMHNKIVAYEKGYISVYMFVFTYLLSYIKLSRRWIIKQFRLVTK